MANNNNRTTAAQREAFFLVLYKKAFPQVARYVARRGGDLEAAQDIFQDALVICYEKITSAKGEMLINEKAFLLGVSKKLWLQHYRGGSKDQPLDDLDVAVMADEQPATNRILSFLERSGKKCMELLKAFYYDELQAQDVTELFGYSSTHSATVAKYKCMEKVRESVKQNSLSYADFIE